MDLRSYYKLEYIEILLGFWGMGRSGVWTQVWFLHWFLLHSYNLISILFIVSQISHLTKNVVFGFWDWFMVIFMMTPNSFYFLT
jgi:hypothetical protein